MDSKNLMRFDNKKALELFKILEDYWSRKKGFCAGLTAPQIEFFPEELRGDLKRMGQWFFFMSIPMRGGINSSDAFKFVFELHGQHPDLFDAAAVMKMMPRDISERTKKVALRLKQGASGFKEEGTFSYQSGHHAEIWIHNASVLSEHWGGDIRNVFWGVRDFEDAFSRIDHKKNIAGFRGMRRKIFSLLTTWLQEFGLIRYFPMPLIIDFHAIRLLLELDILKVNWEPLGPNKPKKPERLRPESMWNWPSFKISEKGVDKIIAWSQKFILKHSLSQYDVAHGMWFLSRELCRHYLGNRSEELRSEGRRTVTETILHDADLKKPEAWPAKYRDLCFYCPVESMCKYRIPAGPYFDWGAMVRAGKHITYPGRHADLNLFGKDAKIFLKNKGKTDIRQEIGSEGIPQLYFEY